MRGVLAVACATVILVGGLTSDWKDVPTWVRVCATLVAAYLAAAFIGSGNGSFAGCDALSVCVH